MSAAHWGGATALFLASAVEWVEAFTIVLAVALTIGWRRAGGAAAAALAVVAVLIAVTGAGLAAAHADIDRIRAAIGIFLLLFGLRWYVKAIRRYGGRTALHDEAKEFAETREHSSMPRRGRPGWSPSKACCSRGSRSGCWWSLSVTPSPIRRPWAARWRRWWR